MHALGCNIILCHSMTASDMSFGVKDKGRGWPQEFRIKAYALWPRHIYLPGDIHPYYEYEGKLKWQ